MRLGCPPAALRPPSPRESTVKTTPSPLSPPPQPQRLTTCPLPPPLPAAAAAAATRLTALSASTNAGAKSTPVGAGLGVLLVTVCRAGPRGDEEVVARNPAFGAVRPRPRSFPARPCPPLPFPPPSLHAQSPACSSAAQRRRRRSPPRAAACHCRYTAGAAAGADACAGQRAASAGQPYGGV